MSKENIPENMLTLTNSIFIKEPFFELFHIQSGFDRSYFSEISYEDFSHFQDKQTPKSTELNIRRAVATSLDHEVYEDTAFYCLEYFLERISEDLKLTRMFVLYVTGLECVPDEIKVEFDGCEQIIPRAATCSNVLTLSRYLRDHVFFSSEFAKVRNNDDSFRFLQL